MIVSLIYIHVGVLVSRLTPTEFEVREFGQGSRARIVDKVPDSEFGDGGGFSAREEIVDERYRRTFKKKFSKKISRKN